jgi:cystathionine beta-lyase
MAKGVTRSVHLSTSLHYASLSSFRDANGGTPQLDGQSGHGLDHGYGLQGNPTHHQLQDEISQLEKGKHTLLYPSGLTALTALSALLQSGDHWLIPDGVYAPVLRYATYLQDRHGVMFSVYDPQNLDTLRKAITPQTKLIHIESPCSITFEVTNIAGVVAIAKKHKIMTSADNTWASGVLCQPLALGIDISILSLTKYAAGYSDVFMGSVTTSDAAIFKQLAYHHRVYGYTVSPVSVMLVQRGLESLSVRLAAHGANTRELIDVVKQHPQVAQVHTASAEHSPELNGTNGLFSIQLTRVVPDHQLEEILAKLRVFAIGESWGGTRSMVLPFQPEDFADRNNPPTGTVLRLHSGLEDVDKQTVDLRLLLDAIQY